MTSTHLVRLPFRPPLHPDSLFGHLAATGVPGVEEWRDGAFRRSIRTPHGYAVAALSPAPDHIVCRLRLTDPRDLDDAVARCRWLLDLDVDPGAVDSALADDPLLAPLVARRPGIRVPRSVDPEELALRAVLGQQVSTAATRTHAARLVTAHGQPIDDPDGGLTHLFPSPAELLALDPGSLALPGARRATFVGLVAALAHAEVHLDASDIGRSRTALGALRGIGPWTVETVAMRGLGDRDAFLATDLGIGAAAALLDLPVAPRALAVRAERWKPWRAYAVQHLWATGDHAVNRMPT
ncbi:MAG: AlkA N-terminal domain-containing protein [Lapillicoccus sp.]